MNAKAQVALSALAIATRAVSRHRYRRWPKTCLEHSRSNGKARSLARKLFEDDHIRVARCTFPKGTIHVCHTRPSYLTYVLSGGQAAVQDDKGKRKVEAVTGAFADVPPIPWHEFANVGETALQYLVVEKKYQPAPVANRAVCPPRGTQ